MFSIVWAHKVASCKKLFNIIYVDIYNGKEDFQQAISFISEIRKKQFDKKITKIIHGFSCKNICRYFEIKLKMNSTINLY